MDRRQAVRIVDSQAIHEIPGLGTLQRETTFSPAFARRAASNAAQWLLDQQHADGFWVGELEGDTILESEYILLLAFLGRHNSSIAHKAAAYLLKKQLPTGGWAMYTGGKLEISGSVKAYFALKLTGHEPSSEPMERARAAILAHGGADAVNSFTRFYLALLGQIPYSCCPAVPPELVYLPKWFPVNLYAMSSWSRTIVVPLSIMAAVQPVVEFGPRFGIRELFLKAPEHWPALRCPGLRGGTGLFSWDRFFRTVNSTIKFCERRRLLPWRANAIEAAKQWMFARFEGSDGLGAIFPPMIFSVIALRSLGYNDDSPELQFCYKQLEGLHIEENDTLRLQPCLSPVWDTGITVRALSDAGVSPSHPSIQRSIEWLLSKQIRCRGDWSHTVNAEPGGWCFEHANDFYPDVDDTAMVIMSLVTQYAHEDVDAGARIRLLDERLEESFDDAGTTVARTVNWPLLEKLPEAIARAERWMLAMQNRDGGWGAFDRDNDSQFLCYVPFADHNAMTDPSTPDLTGRVLESLGKLGHRVGSESVDRAVAYVRDSQEADGSWFGRWGVNYIYGTWQVLTGLAEVGVPVNDPSVIAGVNWLLAYQQPSGAWGESCDSYDDPTLRGQGPATASQTAWALLGLISAGRGDHPAVARGMRWLIDTQLEDGTWDEPEFTGTGFPRVFYLRYHLYRIYFPLMALARWRQTKAMADVQGAL